jgi:hypothetical protein
VVKVGKGLIEYYQRHFANVVPADGLGDLQQRVWLSKKNWATDYVILGDPEYEKRNHGGEWLDVKIPGHTPCVDGDVIYVRTQRIDSYPSAYAYGMTDSFESVDVMWLEAYLPTNLGGWGIVKLHRIPDALGDFGIMDQYNEIKQAAQNPDPTKDTPRGKMYFHYPLAIYHEKDGVGTIENLRLGSPIAAPLILCYGGQNPPPGPG